MFFAERISLYSSKGGLIMYGYNNKITLLKPQKMVGTGWLPPMVDRRDYTIHTPEIKLMTKKLGIPENVKTLKYLPPKVDLRVWCTPVEDQFILGSCTANAGVGIVEYFQKRAFNKHLEGSRLFVYKVTRNLLGFTGDDGAFIKTTMAALSLFGVPHEEYFPYTLDGLTPNPDWNVEPSAFLYSLADNYEASKYFSHDPLGHHIPAVDVLRSVKTYLAAGVPAMFGFYIFSSFQDSEAAGQIPYPWPGDSVIGGHAVVAVGYDDAKVIRNTTSNQETKGAFLIRNSWGKEWGEEGYGWIPYEYVRSGNAFDFWSLLSMKWLDTDEFGL
jgi:C1A family cysteine protease